jgi:hypothetical protein
MKSKQSGGGRSRVKGKTKLKITHENKGDKIYTKKKARNKGINPKKKDRRKKYFLLLRK